MQKWNKILLAFLAQFKLRYTVALYAQQRQRKLYRQVHSTDILLIDTSAFQI